MKENQQPITGLGAGETAAHVFLCGDPARVPKISDKWDRVREVCSVREYVVHTGSVDGVEMTAASTGIGGPSTAVILEELIKLGAAVVIRVGNSGALHEDVALGDYVVTTGSIRDDGTSRSYVRNDYPAVADYRVVSALMQAAESSETPVHAGVTWSVDAFYARNKVLTPDGGLGSMCADGFEQSGMNEDLLDVKRTGALNIEMESATILTLCSLFGVQGGCICTVSDRAPWPGPGQDMISLDRNIRGAIEVAVTAMLNLAQGGSKS